MTMCDTGWKCSRCGERKPPNRFLSLGPGAVSGTCASCDGTDPETLRGIASVQEEEGLTAWADATRAAAEIVEASQHVEPPVFGR